ncbi:BTAD domain-containing putative transcriptional regulator [Alsobacter sp. R-9]
MSEFWEAGGSGDRSGARYHLRVLGPFELVGPRGAVDLGRGKLCGLMAALAMGGGSRPREALASLLWGSHFELQAQQNLRQAIARLRTALGPDVLVADLRQVGLAPGAVACDAARFEACLADGGADAVEEAMRLYGGFLTDVVIREPGWSDWARDEKARLETRLLDSLVARGSERLAANDLDRALAAGRRAVELDPLREDAHRLVIRALAASGRRAEALRQVEVIAGLLRSQLKVEPDPETLALATGLRRGEQAPPRPSAPAIEATLRAAGTSSAALVALSRDGHGAGQAAEAAARLGARIVHTSGGGTLWAFPDLRAAAAAALSLVGGQGGLAAGLDVPGGDGGEERAGLLAQVAPPGTVLASEDARAGLFADVDADIEDLGAVGGGEAVRAYRLEQATQAMGRSGPPPLWPAVAVVPFETTGGDAGLAGLGDVLADEIIVSLARSGELTVISRLSTGALRSRALAPGRIRELLHANYVLSGRCHVLGARLRIAIEFTDTRTGEVLWADSQVVGVEDVLQPDGIVDAVAARVATTVAQTEVRHARAGSIATLEDSTLLIGAIALMHQLSLPKFELAREMLEALAARAPRRAAPHAWLAMLSVLRTSQGWSSDLARDARLAADHAARALDAEPDCSLALAVDGHVNTHYLRRFDIAESRFELAVEAGPNDALAWLLKSTLHTFRGEGEPALNSAERALLLSPLDPRRWYYDALAASAAVSAQDYERAVALARRSIRANRTHSSTFRALTIALSLAGRVDEARQAARDLLTLQPDLTVSAYRERHPSGAFAIGDRLAQALRIAGVPE